jgi:hypothetical protein
MRAVLGSIVALVIAALPAAAQKVVIEDVDDEEFEMLDDDDPGAEDWDDEGWGEVDWGAEKEPAVSEEEWDEEWDESVEGADDEADFSIKDWARDHLDFGGYYENQFAVFALPRHTSDPGGWGVDIMDYNKLRVDLAVRPLPGFSADADVVIRTFHGTTTYHLADMLPSKFDADLAVLEAIDPSLTAYRLENEIYLDNAYVTAHLKGLRLRLGKQQIRFGSGYLWNPSDPFNIKDLLDPSYEKVGVTCLRIQLFLPNEGLVEFYALPEPDFADFHLEDTALAFRVRKALGRWVFASTYVYTQDLAVIGADGSMLRSGRHLLGFEVTGEIGGVGVWGEAAFNKMDRASWDGLARIGRPVWFEALGGLSYTFRGGTTIMAEYLYNGRGAAHSGDYSLWQWLSYLDQTIRVLGSHYASATIQVPTDSIHTTWSLTTILNVSDRSFVLNPWIRFNWNQYLALMIYGAFTWGGDPADEMRALGQGGYVRLRFSF